MLLNQLYHGVCYNFLDPRQLGTAYAVLLPNIHNTTDQRTQYFKPYHVHRDVMVTYLQSADVKHGRH